MHFLSYFSIFLCCFSSYASCSITSKPLKPTVHRRIHGFPSEIDLDQSHEKAKEKKNQQLVAAVCNNQESQVERFLREGANPNSRLIRQKVSVLGRAIEDGSDNTVRLLLAYNANPNVRNRDGVPLLRSVIQKPSIRIMFLERGACCSVITPKEGALIDYARRHLSGEIYQELRYYHNQQMAENMMVAQKAINKNRIEISQKVPFEIMLRIYTYLQYVA